jgi:spore germination cell wall hydrolase CwlJ-like protein
MMLEILDGPIRADSNCVLRMMSRFAVGRSSKLVLAVVLTGSVAGAALAAEAVRIRASDVSVNAPSASPAPSHAAPRTATATDLPINSDEAHAARVALFREKVDALKSVQGSFWGPAAPARTRRGTRAAMKTARLALPTPRHAIARPALAAPVLMPAEQLRAEVSKSDADCLAQAVYFEARSEPAAGQAAVAQVVMNRVRSPYYPKSVCGVVFQGAAHAGCQFSFACDGSLRRGVRDQAAWTRAQDVAGKVLHGDDNALRLAPALNYHADYVKPKWASRLARVEQIGRHIFYQAVGGLLPEGGKAGFGKPPAPAVAPAPDRPLPAWA